MVPLDEHTDCRAVSEGYVRKLRKELEEAAKPACSTRSAAHNTDEEPSLEPRKAAAATNGAVSSEKVRCPFCKKQFVLP